MIELLDYILDSEDNFWITASIEEDCYYGYIVYKVDDNGDRYNTITKKYYHKGICKKLELLPKYKCLFKPRDFFRKNKNKLTGVWEKFVKALNMFEIDDKNIGIFGSFLIGFNIIKDVDFVIYGYDNLLKYYKHNDEIKIYIGASYISSEHIKYQYKKHCDLFSEKCDLEKIIGRNWSGVQIKKGVLSTPRFIELEEMIIPKDNGQREVIQLSVLEGLTTALLPRRAKVLWNNEIYTLLSNIWKYQSFLEDGDIIECLANVDREKKLIVLYDNSCYVKFLN